MNAVNAIKYAGNAARTIAAYPREHPLETAFVLGFAAFGSELAHFFRAASFDASYNPAWPDAIGAAAGAVGGRFAGKAAECAR